MFVSTVSAAEADDGDGILLMRQLLYHAHTKVTTSD